MSTTKLGPAPFPGKRALPELPPGALRVTNYPFTKRETSVVSKYETLAAALVPGDCVECTDGRTANKIANGIIKYIKRQGKDWVVRYKAKMPDGIPRIWLLETSQANKPRAMRGKQGASK